MNDSKNKKPIIIGGKSQSGRKPISIGGKVADRKAPSTAKTTIKSSTPDAKHFGKIDISKLKELKHKADVELKQEAKKSRRIIQKKRSGTPSVGGTQAAEKNKPSKKQNRLKKSKSKKLQPNSRKIKLNPNRRENPNKRKNPFYQWIRHRLPRRCSSPIHLYPLDGWALKKMIWGRQ